MTTHPRVCGQLQLDLVSIYREKDRNAAFRAEVKEEADVGGIEGRGGTLCKIFKELIRYYKTATKR